MNFRKAWIFLESVDMYGTLEQRLVDPKNAQRDHKLWWHGGSTPDFEPCDFDAPTLRKSLYLVKDNGISQRIGVATDGEVSMRGILENKMPGYELLAVLPPIFPESLGDPSFCATHSVRFPYIAGEMANGIASVQMVVEMANAGMLSFFGAGGLGFEKIEKALNDLDQILGDRKPWGVNLLYTPESPSFEERFVDFCIRKRVRHVSASAFMKITPALVRYAATGLSIDHRGEIRRRHFLFAKISRTEVARQFLSPAPTEILDRLVSQGLLASQEAELAKQIPLAEDITVEADSAGHTDGRPLTVLLPLISRLRDEISKKHGYKSRIRLGAAGGLGTPTSVAAAFALGAAYVLTGSINQAAVESELSDEGKQMLANAESTDVTMAPSADMFELRVRVQVLKRGTMYGAKAQRLYDFYCKYDSLEAIPQDLLTKLERDYFRAPITSIWEETKVFWKNRDESQLRKAENDPKTRMALIFRWYLGHGTRWAIAGEPSRKADYQIWCGAAMGAFNDWTAGSHLAEPKNRTVVQIAYNLLEGAATVTRAHQLRSYGVHVSPAAFCYKPRMLRLGEFNKTL
jgi:trans-AT polyketide synthase, acyltransferase and oxidoreductase domains